MNKVLGWVEKENYQLSGYEYWWGKYKDRWSKERGGCGAAVRMHKLAEKYKDGHAHSVCL